MKHENSERGTLLIVDDEPANVQTLAKLMRDEYRVFVAAGGEKALEVATGDTPLDLVLLDIQMPDLDGFEVCRRLKNDPRTSAIPVIFVTARDSVGDEEEGFALGAVDYISKPFHPALVRARVRTHMRLKQKTDLLETLVMLDGLTDIPNRRYFEDQLQREYRRAARDRLSLSLIMIDVDSFKAYNDHYGHGAGDHCLRTVARTLNTAAGRPRDTVARYGGEEFVALLPSTDRPGAMEVAEQMRRSVEDLGITHEHSEAEPVVTVSLGLATTVPVDDPVGPESSLPDGDTSRDEPPREGSIEADSPRDSLIEDGAAQLLKNADAALYQAKRSGRNQVFSG